MPLYIDFHKDMQGVTDEVARDAHLADVEVQDELGVKYRKFWVNKEKGFVFCLIEGPNKEACEAVHKKSHGHLACEIIEVTPADIAVYMGPGDTNASGAAVHPDGKYDSAIRIFLFTDIVGSTKMTQQYGDVGAFKILTKHNQIVRSALGQFSGKEVKHTGDGIMASFSSASKCAAAAIRIQQDIKSHNADNKNLPFELKIGINAGEPVTEGDDFFGVAVQLTARLCALSEPNQILTSMVVKSLCMGRMIQFNDIGKLAIKGFANPIEICEIVYDKDSTGQ